jgi:hypothetical protein
MDLLVKWGRFKCTLTSWAIQDAKQILRYLLFIPSSHQILLNVQLLNVYHVISWYLCSLCLNFFHLLAERQIWKKKKIYSNKFFHDFHLAESSFTCPRLRISGLAWRLSVIVNMYMYCLNLSTFYQSICTH